MYAVRPDHSQVSPVIFKLLTEMKGQPTFSRSLTISHPQSTLRLDRMNPVANGGMGTMQTLDATRWGFQNGMSHYEQLVKERDSLLDQVKSLNHLLVVYREEKPRFETLLQSLSPIFHEIKEVNKYLVRIDGQISEHGIPKHNRSKLVKVVKWLNEKAWHTSMAQESPFLESNQKFERLEAIAKRPDLQESFHLFTTLFPKSDTNKASPMKPSTSPVQPASFQGDKDLMPPPQYRPAKKPKRSKTPFGNALDRQNISPYSHPNTQGQVIGQHINYSNGSNGTFGCGHGGLEGKSRSDSVYKLADGYNGTMGDDQGGRFGSRGTTGLHSGAENGLAFHNQRSPMAIQSPIARSRLSFPLTPETPLKQTLPRSYNDGELDHLFHSPLHDHQLSSPRVATYGKPATASKKRKSIESLTNEEINHNTLPNGESYLALPVLTPNFQFPDHDTLKANKPTNSSIPCAANSSNSSHPFRSFPDIPKPALTPIDHYPAFEEFCKDHYINNNAQPNADGTNVSCLNTGRPMTKRRKANR